MPLTLRNLPTDVDEVGLTRLVRAAFAVAPDSSLAKILSQLRRNLETAKAGEVDQSTHLPDQLNFLALLVSKHLSLLLEITAELNDQVERFLDEHCIEVVTPGKTG